MSAKLTKKKNITKCELCNKPSHKKDLGKAGDHVGNGGTLGQRIMADKYKPGKSAKDHPLSIPKRKGYSYAQAHHLICSEVLTVDGWEEVCSVFGYDINCIENGVFFPADMRVACELEIPLHRGNHSETETDETPDYVGFVSGLVLPLLDAALGGEFCKKGKDIVKEMNDASKELWQHIKNFDLLLTYDGLDYESGGKGCCKSRSLPTKRENKEKAKEKKCDRQHGILLNKSDYFKEQSK